MLVREMLNVPPKCGRLPSMLESVIDVSEKCGRRQESDRAAGDDRAAQIERP